MIGLIVVIVVAPGAAEAARLTASAQPPAGFRGQSIVSCAAGHPAVQAVGATCSNQFGFIPGNFDLNVFAQQAQALRAPIGTPVSIAFYNNNCYESPAIRVYIRYAEPGSTAQDPTKDATIAPVITIPPTAPGQYSPALAFRMPNVGQSRGGGQFSVLVSFSGTLQRCNVISVVEGDFIIKGGAPPPNCESAVVHGTRSLSAAVPTATEACPLKVYVRVLQHIRSGLAIDDPIFGGSPVHFTGPTAGGHNGTAYAAAGEEGQKCRSGCANILITVVDQATHKAAAGAEVTASVAPIAKLDLESQTGYRGLGGLAYFGEPLAANDNEFLCVQSDISPGAPQPRCGTKLSGLTADQKGQVRLIYWAPGLVDPAKTTLDVSAKETCGARACSSKLKEGSATPTTLTVRPNLIYQSSGELSVEEIDGLVGMEQDGLFYEVRTEAAKQAFEKTFHAGLVWLADAERIAVSVAHAAASPLVTEALFAPIAIDHLNQEYKEELELIGSFLKALHFSAIGVYDEPLEAKAVAEISAQFAGKILYDLPVRAFTGASGVLWDDAVALEKQLHTPLHGRGRTFYSGTRPERVDLAVYEISSCSESHPSCGPGYQSATGIQPELCLEFNGEDGNQRVPLHFQKQICVPYDARIFAQSQLDLIHRLP